MFHQYADKENGVTLHILKKNSMKIGKRTQELMRIYSLSNEDVAFAQLMAAGRTQLEAYYIAYFNKLATNPDSPQRAAHQLITDRPNIIELTRALQAYTTDSRQAKDKGKEAHMQAKGKSNSKASLANITTKEGQLEELRSIYNELTSPKDRLDALKQTADLQQLKHEQTTEEDRRTHYYLPMKCALCPYKPADTANKGDKQP